MTSRSEGPSRTASGARARRPGLPSTADYAALLLVLAGLIALFGVLSDHFLSAITFRTLATQVPPLVVIAVGMTFVLVIAGIDLSVGSVAALSGSVLGVLMVQGHWPLVAGLPVAVLVGLACGSFNGFVSVRWSIPSFIVTLGMLEIARGGAYLVSSSQTMYVGSGVAVLGSPIGGWGPSPAFVASLLVVVAGQVVLSRTVFGRTASRASPPDR